MKSLFERDFSILTEQEITDKDIITDRYTKKTGNLKVMDSSYFRKLPKAIRHYESLFPNNYMDIEDLNDKDKLSKQNDEFYKIIENHTSTEIDIKRYIDGNCAYEIIASIFKLYRFGHHDAYLFKEFKLGTYFQADYVLVGRASGGHQFVFIECENPYNKITISDGDFGETIRKGINQINDWKAFLSSEYPTISAEFKKYTDKQLPEEFYKYDPTRFNYIVIAGRRKDFNDKTYRLARSSKEDNKIGVLHYDNVFDLAQNIMGKASY
jgi:hypothetical protein